MGKRGNCGSKSAQVAGGWSATTWWAWVKSGKAPKPFKLGPGTTVWLAEDIHAFIARLIAEAKIIAASDRGASLTAARRRKRAMRTPQGTP